MISGCGLGKHDVGGKKEEEEEAEEEAPRRGEDVLPTRTIPPPRGETTPRKAAVADKNEESGEPRMVDGPPMGNPTRGSALSVGKEVELIVGGVTPDDNDRVKAGRGGNVAAVVVVPAVAVAPPSSPWPVVDAAADVSSSFSTSIFFLSLVSLVSLSIFIASSATSFVSSSFISSFMKAPYSSSTFATSAVLAENTP
jgi:hypothetical protein